MNRKEKQKVIGVTGGVGAGKSTILDYLEQHYQATVIRADDVAARLEEPGQPCYRQIVQEFGQSFLDPDGRLNRKKLAEEVFARPQRLKKLNEIVHPAVEQWIRNEIARQDAIPDETMQDETFPDKAVCTKGTACGKAVRCRWSITAVEAALLLESGYDRFCDEVWYIYVPEELRIRRLMKSRGYSEEKCRQIMANQLPEKEFRKKCQILIDNSSADVQNTYGQIDSIIESWNSDLASL